MFLTKSITSLAGLGSFAAYFAAAIVLLIIFAIIYPRVTPYREFPLIGGGNSAAACSMGGAILGFAIPLASVIAHSAGLLDMIIWGFIALLIQVGTFVAVRIIFPSIVSDIPHNQLSKGIFLGIISLAVGILNAACMT
jgi:putative membrane protein